LVLSPVPDARPTQVGGAPTVQGFQPVQRYSGVNPVSLMYRVVALCARNTVGLTS
jgi:hypothetical protein